jgi:hypothetical protein
VIENIIYIEIFLSKLPEWGGQLYSAFPSVSIPRM